MIKYFCLIIFFTFGLGGCGPKVVGEDVAPHTPSGYGSPAHDVSQLRYPISGNRIETKLYLLNHPNNMNALQNSIEDDLENFYDGTLSEYKNLQPRQISPFRQ